MARRIDHEKAVALRKQGKSYSEIKNILGINKSTLSGWLREYPLSAQQMQQLRDLNPRRIESYRATCQKRRDARVAKVYDKVRRDIRKFSRREFFLSGLCLYWAEGTKRHDACTAIANTDPALISFFVKWLENLGVLKNRLRVRLHLYKDMNVIAETRYWSNALRIPLSQFRTPYIKDSNKAAITYQNGYGHGTCNIMYGNKEMNDYVLQGIRHIRTMIEQDDIMA